MFQYLDNCPASRDPIQLLTFPKLFKELPRVNFQEYLLNVVCNHSEIIETNTNWSHLFFDVLH